MTKVKPGDIVQRVKFFDEYYSYVSYMVVLHVYEDGDVLCLANWDPFKGNNQTYAGTYNPSELVPTGNRFDIEMLTNVFQKGRAE